MKKLSVKPVRNTKTNKTSTNIKILALTLLASSTLSLATLTIVNNTLKSPTIAVTSTVNKESVKVLRVVDGDTFEIIYNNEKTKVRLIGVDTPETVKVGIPIQPFGKEASEYTKKVLEGRIVQLEFDKGKVDVYKRLLAYIYLEDGSMFNKTLIKEGYAKASKVYPNIKYAKEFEELQKLAQSQHLGMWK
jgi:micrococcal nuclease